MLHFEQEPQKDGEGDATQLDNQTREKEKELRRLRQDVRPGRTHGELRLRAVLLLPVRRYPTDNLGASELPHGPPHFLEPYSQVLKTTNDSFIVNKGVL